MAKNRKSKVRKFLYLWLKRSMCKKQLKKIDCFIQSRNEIISEIKYFPEIVLDIIIIAQPKRISEVVDLINAELEIRSMLDGIEKTVYTIGRAKEVFGYDKINEQL